MHLRAPYKPITMVSYVSRSAPFTQDITALPWIFRCDEKVHQVHQAFIPRTQNVQAWTQNLVISVLALDRPDHLALILPTVAAERRAEEEYANCGLEDAKPFVLRQLRVKDGMQPSVSSQPLLLPQRNAYLNNDQSAEAMRNEDQWSERTLLWWG